MSAIAILITTVDCEDKAREMARAALAAKLAACVQIQPVHSHYVWKGELCETPEFLLQMKHRAGDYPELAQLVRRLHSYETPEILRLDAVEADPAYEAWLGEATSRD